MVTAIAGWLESPKLQSESDVSFLSPKRVFTLFRVTVKGN